MNKINTTCNRPISYRIYTLTLDAMFFLIIECRKMRNFSSSNNAKETW